MYQVKFTDENGKNRVLNIQDCQMWLTNGNFSGMGNFTKLKIKKLKNPPLKV